MPKGDPIRVLLLEDSESDSAILITQLRRGGFEPDSLRVESREDFVAALRQRQWDLIIVDYNLPSFSAMEALEVYKELALDIPFILVSGTVGEEVAVEALKAGGHDYMLKDRLVRLVPAVRRELREAQGRAARRSAEQNLRESIELFSGTFRASPDAMAVVDLESGRIIESNERHDRLFGPPDNTGGKPEGALFSGWEEPADFERILGIVWERGSLHEHEARRRNAKGATLNILVSAERLKLGSRKCAVMVFRDITEWRSAQASAASLEAQLRQSQKLEAIGRLAGGIAHDFNNILAAIMGNAQLADMELNAGHPAKENIRQTLLAAVRARELIGQILVFSRHGDGRRKPIHLDGFVRDSIRLLKATVPKTIEVVTVLPESVPPILANNTQLLQVLLNLSTNAVQSMEPAGGRLEIAVKTVTIRAANPPRPGSVAPGEYVSLKVTDTGCGMDAAVIERIFEPFFTTKEADKGTGLGLSMVHGIVKQHEGHVVVQSAPGKGTSFELYFPVRREAAQEESAVPWAPAKEAHATGRGQRVMVLDDEEGLSMMIEGVLEHYGYAVEAFTEPALALAAFRESPERYSLVITDLTMPKMKGTGVAEAIWQVRPKTPILLITGFGTVVDLEPYRAMGMHGPLSKPFLAETLISAVAECLAAPKG